MDDALSHFISVHLARAAAAREEACEAALQTGECGVLEEWQPDGSITFTVSSDVPWGQIYVKGQPITPST